MHHLPRFHAKKTNTGVNWILLPDALSHILTLPSVDADANAALSEEKSTSLTASVWPRNSLFSGPWINSPSPPLIVNILMVLSSDAEARYWQSADIVQAFIAPWWTSRKKQINRIKYSKHGMMLILYKLK